MRSISSNLLSASFTGARAFASMAAMGALLACSASMAQPKDGASGGRQGPPAEALSACKTAKSGDSCSFSTPNGNTVSGSCMAPQSRPLACAPAKGQGQDSGSSAAPR